MEKESDFNLEDIYYNMDGQAEQPKEQHNKNLLHVPSSKSNTISSYCSYIYNYLLNWFFPSHINSLYE
jgi:hypothetical protein